MNVHGDIDLDTLFGLTIDPGTGRTLSVQLERVP